MIELNTDKSRKKNIVKIVQEIITTCKIKGKCVVCSVVEFRLLVRFLMMIE